MNIFWYEEHNIEQFPWSLVSGPLTYIYEVLPGKDRIKSVIRIEWGLALGWTEAITIKGFVCLFTEKNFKANFEGIFINNFNFYDLEIFFS